MRDDSVVAKTSGFIKMNLVLLWLSVILLYGVAYFQNASISLHNETLILMLDMMQGDANERDVRGDGHTRV